MLITHKIALDPNNQQRTYFRKAVGTSRFAYNWALAEWKRQYADHKADPSLLKPTANRLDKQLNAIKRQQFPWMFDVSAIMVQCSVRNLGDAFDRFFKGTSCYPTFKKRGGRDSFCAARQVGEFQIDGKWIKLPKIGWIRMWEALRFKGKLRSITISRQADRWFASILIDAAIRQRLQSKPIIGVDIGITTLATLSNGQKITGAKAEKRLRHQLRRANKSLMRKRRGSRNRDKARKRLARIHARISHVRNDVIHKLTHMLTKTYKVIGIEDLNVRGMVKNRHLARSISDVGFHEFKRQLVYKAKWYGAKVVVADRWFPSSKTCSCCGSVKAELDLSQRTYHCDQCGFECDRDVNAAINLEKMAASSAVSACGEVSSGHVRENRVKPASRKQEPTRKAR